MVAELSAPGRNRPGVTAGSARSLLLTVLGELVRPADEPVWTASLLYLLTRLGLEEQTVRQAILRGASSGWISGERQGRQVVWTLTPAGRDLLRRGERRAYTLSSDAPAWDGRWLVALISVPNDKRSVRKALYDALRRRGLGNPMAGVWLTPHTDRAPDVGSQIEKFGLGESVVAVAGELTSFGLSEADIVARSWDLEQIATSYVQLLARFSGSDPAPGDQLLLTHVRLVNEWQHIPLIDPQLPRELLPDWIGRRAMVVFSDLRERWSADVRQRWAEIVETTAQDLDSTVA